MRKVYKYKHLQFGFWSVLHVYNKVMFHISSELLVCLLLFHHVQGGPFSNQMDQLREQLEGVTNQIFFLKLLNAQQIEEEVNNLREEMMAKMEELTAENRALRKTMDDMEAMTREELVNLQTSLAESTQSRGLPYAVSCAYQDKWGTASATITYDSLLSDWKNDFDPKGADGVMDIKTGQYTVIRPAGHYTITFSATAVVPQSQDMIIYLYHNGNRVKESPWWSYALHDETKPGSYMHEQGSRTVILHLDQGDTIELRTNSSSHFHGVLYNVNLCISLTSWDYNTTNVTA